VFIEHTEEATGIVSGRFPVVIPFLGVTSYLIGVVKLESDERINNLRGAIKYRSTIVLRNETETRQSNLERRSGLGIAEKCNVLIDKEYVGRRFRRVL
jgi:hypothetical protein